MTSTNEWIKAENVVPLILSVQRVNDQNRKLKGGTQVDSAEPIRRCRIHKIRIVFIKTFTAYFGV